jgi:hypothetical protein
MNSALILLCGIAVCSLSGWLVHDILNDDVYQPTESPTHTEEDKKPPRFEIISSIYDNKSAK